MDRQTGRWTDGHLFQFLDIPDYELTKCHYKLMSIVSIYLLQTSNLQFSALILHFSTCFPGIASKIPHYLNFLIKKLVFNNNNQNCCAWWTIFWILLRPYEYWVLYGHPADSAGLVEGHTNTVDCSVYVTGYEEKQKHKQENLLVSEWRTYMIWMDSYRDIFQSFSATNIVIIEADTRQSHLIIT